MRGWVARLLALLAPQVGPDHPEFAGSSPDPFAGHPINCKCYFHS